MKQRDKGQRHNLKQIHVRLVYLMIRTRGKEGNKDKQENSHITNRNEEVLFGEDKRGKMENK